MMLPSYTPPSPPPRYLRTAGHGETSLAHTPGERPAPTSTFTKHEGRTSIILDSQEDNIERPSYGRHGVVSGVIYFENPSIVAEVVIKLEGKLEISLLSTGDSMSYKTLNTHCHLTWQTSGNGTTCPNLVPFRFHLPPTFEYEQEYHPMPPSYEILSPGSSGQFVRCRYQLVVAITKRRSAVSLMRDKIMTIPFNYYPRMRPEMPIVSDGHDFFASIKMNPGEWHQATSQSQPSSGHLSPITVDFFIPATRIFAITDIIPFHIQLSGDISSMRAFFPELPPEVYPPTLQPLKASWKRKKPRWKFLRLLLMRRVSVQIHGQTSENNAQTSEGTILPLPPDIFAVSESQELQLHWEGEITGGPNLAVGSFSVPNLSVRDVLVLALTPASKSLFLEAKCIVPIRLVTDTWSGADTSQSQAAV
ncbi:hypothetical protein CCMSSC00406_0006615 [Pleurotus cornucopiae]|uniref:Uncharacterized protein n=1 Tax=Pleurotus cornucopiae TaxID=5321 RepID=A0ACB7IRM3_PLECO|nr:hypothetical protein CCMSSC00406_0006615 [Pleurotus cornucopiae]